jgi:alginate O-acetyltransferase complex protein AlgJ
MRDRLIVVLFAVGIAMPPLATLRGATGGTLLAENRRAAEAPPLPAAVASFGDFAARFEAFYDDAFGFRPTLLRWHSIVKTCWLGVSPSEKVVLGKNGWLFYRGEETMESYRSTRPFKPHELAQWEQIFTVRQAWLANRGIRYLLVVAPNAQTIYPENVPAAFNRVNAISRLDQLAEHLGAWTSIPLVDPRPDLEAAKARERVYWMTDTHWNDRGAFAAYRRIVLTLAQWYPALEPLPREAFADLAFDWPGGDLATMIGLPDVFREELLVLSRRVPGPGHPADPGLPGAQTPPAPSDPQATETGIAALPRGLVLRDSFAVALIPFLADHFQRIVYLPTHELVPADIEREHPDVVIEEFAERMLMKPPPGNRPEVWQEWFLTAGRNR